MSMFTLRLEKDPITGKPIDLDIDTLCGHDFDSIFSPRSDNQSGDIPIKIENLVIQSGFQNYAKYANKPYCISEEQGLIRFSDDVWGKAEIFDNEIIFYLGVSETLQSQDLLAPDLNTFVDYSVMSNFTATQNQDPISSKKKIISLHKTFWTLFSSASKKIIEYLTNILFNVFAGNKVLQITGYNMAGVFAILTALELRKSFTQKRIFLFTYGSPRIGDARFARYVHRALNGMYRITLMDDPIPRLPPQNLGFTHSKTEIWLELKCDCPELEKYDVWQCDHLIDGNANQFYIESEHCINKYGLPDSFEEIQNLKQGYSSRGPYFGIRFRECNEIWE
ncbi:hypothetical protein G9A89_016484 [Geosiphon pyriformis]|nr:hypothetical protein G9A89_016484 [Geosiphon pyriformis]